MSEQLVFDYFYGKEAEMFSFFRIPRLLVKDPHFKELSNDAKILYGLMLDRMSLSVKKEWQDKDGKTFIIYTIKQIAEDLSCSESKAGRVLAELDSKKGIGLVEKVRKGLSEPDWIYVKNFVCVKVVEDEVKEKKPKKPRNSTETSKCNFKKFQNATSRNLKTEFQEVSEYEVKKTQNAISRSSQMEFQEIAERDFNYIDINHTDSSYIDKELYQSINRTNQISTSDIDGWRSCLKSKIEYDLLVVNLPTRVNLIDELLEIMVEESVKKSEYVHIGEEAIPRTLVRERFLRYDYSIMDYVLTSLSKSHTKKKNIRTYLLATLINAPVTIENYYQAEANYDMYGSC